MTGRRQQPFLALAIAGVLCLARLVAAEANRLTNPGFDAVAPDGRPVSWSFAAPTPEAVVCTVEAGPPRALRFTAREESTAGYLEQRLEVTPKTRYVASFRVRVDRGQGLFWLRGKDGPRAWQCRIRLIPDLPRRLVPEFVSEDLATGPPLTAGQWAAFRLPFTTGADQHDLTVSFGLYFSRGDLRFADLAVHEAPPAGAVPVLSPVAASSVPAAAVGCDGGGYPAAPAWPQGALADPVVRATDGGCDIAGAGFDLRFSPAGAVVRHGGRAEPAGAALTRGLDVAAVALDPQGRLAFTAEAVSLTQDSRDGRLCLHTTLEPRLDRLHWRVEVTNRGAAPEWVAVWMDLPAALTGDVRSYWDGAWLHPSLRPGQRRQWHPADLAWRFPLTALWGPAAGWALALAPEEQVSLLNSSCQVTAHGGVQRLGTRLVVAPGATRGVSFVSFRFAPRFGFLDAVQRYYDAFPEAFRPTPGVDPRLQGAGKYLFSGAATRHLEIEASRRTGTDWQWCYAPYQQQGNIFPKPEFWDAANPVRWDLDHDRVKGEPPARIEDWLQAQQRRFHGGADAVANLYYVLADTVGRAVMEAYPDSAMIAADGRPYPSPGRWGITDYVAERAYPDGTAYGAALRAEMRQVWETLAPAGFALDEAHEEKRHYGVADLTAAGLAWDAHGPFVNQAVAFARIIDDAHRLQAGGRVCGVGANKPHNFLVAFRADGGILWEGPAHDHAKPFDSPDPLLSCRLLLGHKAASFWSRYRFDTRLDMQVAWGDLRDADRLAVARGVSEHTLLSAFRLGCYPSELQTFGFQRLQDYMPAMRAVFPRGWQPVPALRTDGRLWLSRYGRDVDSVMVIGNPLREAVRARVEVDTAYLGEGMFLLSSVNGRALACRLEAGTTTFTHDLPAHELVAARVAARVVADGAAIIPTASAACRRDASGPWVAEIALTVAAPTSLRLEVPLPEPGARATGARVDGVPAVFQARDGVVSMRFPATGAHAIAIRFQPHTRFEPADALTVPFALFDSQGRPACNIRIETTAGPFVRRAAHRLQAYAGYAALRRDQPGERLCFLPSAATPGPVPVIEEGGDAAGAAAPAGGGAFVRLAVRPAPDSAPRATITRSRLGTGEALAIVAATPEALERAVLELLDSWDRHHRLAHGLIAFSDRFGLPRGGVLQALPAQEAYRQEWFAPR